MKNCHCSGEILYVRKMCIEAIDIVALKLVITQFLRWYQENNTRTLMIIPLNYISSYCVLVVRFNNWVAL